MLIIAMLLTGCSQNLIREDVVREQLPNIDPELGVERSMQVTLYFRLKDEALLAPVYRNIVVGARESTESTMMNSLLAGPEEGEALLAPTLPTGTRVLSIERNGEQVVVSLSRDFLSTQTGLRSREELRLQQRLAVYAIVNSLCTLRGVTSVQILVDTDGSGVGVAVPPFLLGFQDGEISSQTVGPLKKDTSVTVMPQTIASLALSHLCAGEYEAAYRLFASAGTSAPKPALEEFIRQLGQDTRITAFTARGFSINDNGSYTVTLDLTWMRPDGAAHQAQGALVLVRPEHNMQLMDYHSLLQAMQAGQ